MEQAQDTHPREETNGHRWVAATLLTELWRRFRDGWVGCPAPVKRAWAVTLLGGGVLVAALSWGLAHLGQYLAEAGRLDWEAGLIQWLADETFVSFSLAMWMETTGNSLFAIPILACLAGWAAWHHKPLRALTFAIGFAVYKLTVQIGWWTWDRARPTLIEGGAATPEGLGSYPSGHVTQAVFVYGMMAYLWIRASRSPVERALAVLFMLVMVAGSAVGRLRVGAHWPSDLAAGFVLGLAWLAVGVLALTRADANASRPA